MEKKEKKTNILDTICHRRKLDVQIAQASTSAAALKTRIQKYFPGKPLDLYQRLVEGSVSMRVAAEFKRASPSKGDIAMHISAADQATRYARAGASVVSVLTEPTWFKGSLDDMEAVASAFRNEMYNVTKAPGRDGRFSTRPLVLRKDFILDAYQILEARAYGADTVLIIVAAMSGGAKQLSDLISHARALDMEPLVEVNSESELEVAIASGAKVVGVNNRDLRTFQVDLKTTDRCAAYLERVGNDSVALMALSGVSCRDQVAHYETIGVRAVLVGEALMRATNPGRLIMSLLGKSDEGATRVGDDASKSRSRRRVKVKICGVRSVEDALTAARFGADFIGLIFVPRSKRCVDKKEARNIVETVRRFRESGDRVVVRRAAEKDTASSTWFADRKAYIMSSCERYRPLVVGVFQNASSEAIRDIVRDVGIDLIQLHGDETAAFAAKCPAPTISVLHVDSDCKTTSSSPATLRKRAASLSGHTDALLLDTCVSGGSKKGGTGEVFDWNLARVLQEGTRGDLPLPVVLAGGLTPENVASAVRTGEPWCVDVAGGVADGGGVKKIHEKVKAFVENAKGV